MTATTCPAETRKHRLGPEFAFTLTCASLLGASAAQAAWKDYAGNPQHTAISSVASQPLEYIIWQMPVDLNPQYSGTALYIHYGSPLITNANTILVPVKTGVADSFRVEARNGATGVLLWQYDSDYTLPPHNWVPSYSGTLTPAGRLYIPGAGGTLLYTENTDAAGPHTFTRVAFFGLAIYNGNPTAFNSSVQICTPLTSDAQGNIYFGFRSTGLNPLGMSSGLARIAPDGSGLRVSASTATSGNVTEMLMNCAPALSNDGQTVYVGMRSTSSSPGYLVALSAANLTPLGTVLLMDPNTFNAARLLNEGTSSPMVAPDGKVYFGVVESPSGSNAYRGWLLQFNSNFTPSGAPGAFGWDDTPSVVPAAAAPTYTGSSPYLLMCKYNFYAGVGDGVNKIAILDPNDTHVDAFSGVTTMKEVLTIAGVTPDDQGPAFPNAVREWCINTAVVDPFTHSVLAGSEDGRLYRWDLATNTFTESITLTPGVGEAYTPTLIAPDGKVYAINNATLFAVGAASAAVDPSAPNPAGFRIEPARPDPFVSVTTVPFSLPRAGRVKVDILDVSGRRVTALLDRDLPVGEHDVRWDGRDAGGHARPAGIYFVRIAFGSEMLTRRIAFTR